MTKRTTSTLHALATLAALLGTSLPAESQPLQKKKKVQVARLVPPARGTSASGHTASAAVKPVETAKAEPEERSEPKAGLAEAKVPDAKVPAMMLQQAKGGAAQSEPVSAAQRAVREAERHFQFGKFYLQESKPEQARAEFDQAIDILLDVPEGVPDRLVSERKFEELIRLIHRYDVEGLGSGVTPESPVFVQSPLPEMLDLTFPVDPRLKDRALEIVRASSSQLPLTVNDAVLSYINYFTSERGRRVLLYGLRHAGRYRGMISRILDEEGVPQELIHLAQAESGFMVRAVSPKAACGMWQFVRATGSEYGLQTTRLTDDRLDPEKATRAAARHLRDLYRMTGDWYLAMAAYNCGPACVERAVQKTGYADFWELRARRAIPKETSNYVPVILAMAIVSKNLQSYGIELNDVDPAIEWDTVKLTADTSLALMADALDVPVSEVRDLNPALVKNQAPAGYELHVPKDKGAALVAALESVPEGKRTSWRLHRVSEGETLQTIARRYSITPNSIAAANGQMEMGQAEGPASGEVLLIPAAPVPEPVVRTRGAGRGRAAYKAPAGTRKTAANAKTTVAAKSAPAKPLHR